jgi:hypothetical protein
VQIVVSRLGSFNPIAGVNTRCLGRRQQYDILSFLTLEGSSFSQFTISRWHFALHQPSIILQLLTSRYLR